MESIAFGYLTVLTLEVAHSTSAVSRRQPVVCLWGVAQRAMQADAPNVLAGGGPPTVESATVHGATMKIHFNSKLDTDSEPGKGNFSVSPAGTAATQGQAAAVTYTQPGLKRLRDIFGEPAKGFVDQAVTNTIGSVTSLAFTNLPSAPTWVIGGEIELTATFGAAVTVTGTPRIEAMRRASETRCAPRRTRWR